MISMFSREFDKLQAKLYEHIAYMKTLTQCNPLSMRNELEGMSNIIDDMMGEIDIFLDPEGEDDHEAERWRDQMDYERGI